MSTLVEWALSATPEELERGDWRIVAEGLRKAKARFVEANLGNQSWLDCYVQIAESRGKEPEPPEQTDIDEPEEQVCSSCNGTGIEGIDRGECMMPRCWSCKGSGSIILAPEPI